MDVKAPVTLPIADANCRLARNHQIITSLQWLWSIGNRQSRRINSDRYVDLEPFRETLTLSLRTRSERMREDKVADLSSLSGAVLISSAKVNSRIDACVNHFINPFGERIPLTGDARNCRGDRQVWIVSEDELHDGGNGRAIC